MKKKVMLVVALTLFTAVSAFAGLKEKRAIQDFQNNDYPTLLKEIQAAAGFDVSVKVNWDELAEENMSHLYKESFPKVYFLPVIGALQKICSDDLGKKALQGSLKEIIIKNDGTNFNPDKVAQFKDGILTINHQPTTNISDSAKREKGIVKVLEQAL